MAVGRLWAGGYIVRLPREAVDCPSLEILQTQLGAYLCSLLYGASFAGAGVGGWI